MSFNFSVEGTWGTRPPKYVLAETPTPTHYVPAPPPSQAMLKVFINYPALCTSVPLYLCTSVPLYLCAGPQVEPGAFRDIHNRLQSEMQGKGRVEVLAMSVVAEGLHSDEFSNPRSALMAAASPQPLPGIIVIPDLSAPSTIDGNHEGAEATANRRGDGVGGNSPEETSATASQGGPASQGTGSASGPRRRPTRTVGAEPAST